MLDKYNNLQNADVSVICAVQLLLRPLQGGRVPATNGGALPVQLRC